MYTKNIEMQFERVGKRTRLTGFIGELRDGEILLHSQQYSTNSQAEQALDRIVYELLTDLADQGLVDDVPAAMEAEHVSSTHLPSWLIEAQVAHPAPVCADPDCQGPHYTYQCPAIRAQLFAEPVVMVTDVGYANYGWAA